MDLMKKLFGGGAAETKPDAVVREYTSQAPTIITPASRVWRRGMWVRLNGETGILADLGVKVGQNRDGSPILDVDHGRVHIVGADGRTKRDVAAALRDLRIAAYDDIPAPRRPSRKHGARFGYV